MSDTARDYQTIDAAAVEGLEDLFENLPTGADNVATDVEIVPTRADSDKWVPVIVAASSLMKSERTIQRYAKQGKLQSKTDETGKLLICLPTVADNLASPADTVAEVADILPTLGNDVATAADSEIISETVRLWDLLREKDSKIEALIMRNGYLQAQLESSQEQIKLLSDSQHKAGWWTRFKKWCAGN